MTTMHAIANGVTNIGAQLGTYVINGMDDVGEWLGRDVKIGGKSNGPIEAIQLTAGAITLYYGTQLALSRAQLPKSLYDVRSIVTRGVVGVVIASIGITTIVDACLRVHHRSNNSG